MVQWRFVGAKTPNLREHKMGMVGKKNSKKPIPYKWCCTMIEMYNNHLAYTQQTIQELEGLILVSRLLNGFAGAVESGDGPFQKKTTPTCVS